MNHGVTFDRDLITRYDSRGPRYTSYPTTVQFHEGFGSNEYVEHAKNTNAGPAPLPLSLYFHLPFCSTVCYYCACNKIITRNRAHTTPYLDSLYREVEMQGRLFDRDRTVDQLHWGGGTPTFFSADQMKELMQVTRDNFTLRDDDNGEYSTEIDPREANADTITLLRSLGFNRISLGVQDFDQSVQKAVNRIQSQEETIAIIEAARKEGIKSVSVDLIYGLPLQSVESFSKTLDIIYSMQPDRITVFNYAHLPELFKTQRQIQENQLPHPNEKLNILQHTVEFLTNAGYVYIGMDHFAKPDDDLTLAQQQGNLYRNFQGYSTHADCDLAAIGISSISKIGNCYAQNVRTTEEYEKHISSGEIPVFRGVELDKDDLLRRDVITQLICNFELEFSVIEEKHNIDFADYFHNELQELKEMQSDKLLNLDMERIVVSSAGRFLIRNICMVFDKYLQEEKNKHSFSKTI